jgi:hypothetical protein
MIAGLLRRDPSVRSLTRLLPASALTASVLMGMFAWLGAMQHRPVSMGQQVAVIWLGATLFLLLGGGRTRCAALDLTLPLSPRRLWLAHVLAVILGGMAVMACSAGFVLLHNWVVWRLSERWTVIEPGGVVLAVHLAAGLILAVALSQSPTPGQQKIALALGLRTYRSLPTAFTVLPRGAARRRPGTAARGVTPTALQDSSADWAAMAHPARRGLAYQWRLHTTIFWFLAKKPVAYVVVLPFYLMMGAFLGWGWVGEYRGRFAWILITAYMLFLAFGAPLNRVGLIDALPISRRRILAVLLLPGTLMVASGYAVGRVGLVIGDNRSELVTYRKDQECCHYLYVPARCLKLALDGRAPENGSPWGETHPAYTQPLFRGSRAVLYSPYHTPPGSSIEFVALQISRATAAVYGRAVPPEEIRERYLEVDADGHVGLKTAGLTLRHDYPDLEAPPEGPVFPVVFLIVGLVTLLSGRVYLEFFRAGIKEWVRKTVFITILVALLGLHVAQFIALVSGLTRVWVVSGFMHIVVKQAADALPGGAIAVWAICGLVLAGCYLLVQRRFERIDVVAVRPSAAGCAI